MINKKDAWHGWVNSENAKYGAKTVQTVGEEDVLEFLDALATRPKQHVRWEGPV